MYPWIKNRSFLISLLLTIAPPAWAADAETLLKSARSAYADNRCPEAIKGFHAYLKQANPADAKRKAIQDAIAWCEERERIQLARSRQMEMVGAGYVPAQPEPSAPQRLPEPTPATP